MRYQSSQSEVYNGPVSKRQTKARMRLSLTGGLLLLAALLGGCGKPPWNNPYPASEARANIIYRAFAERPKHLDPVRSYNSNEYAFIAQIYEPPLQYHYLRRPYQLVPLTARRMPHPVYLDADGNRLPQDAPVEAIATSVYRIEIRPGIRYQPHPCFARGADGAFRYHHLSAEQAARVHRLSDLPETGSRELVAEDYVYQIKRLASPHLHSPIAGLMGEYIIGFRELSRELAKLEPQGSYVDLRKYRMEGVRVIDRYTYEVRIRGKYPQFIYWFAMPFLAPMPWEAERFYAQPGLARNNVTLDWYPVGTGPFMLTVNNPNLRMVLERNPNFRGEPYPEEGEEEDRDKGLLVDAGRRMPFADKVVFSLEKENIPYWNKFLQGYYDTSGLASDSFDQAVRIGSAGEARLTEPMLAKGIALSTAVTTSIYYMGFNMLDPVVGGYGERARKLRQAISIAVDYEEYISIFANGRGRPAQGPIPPGIFGAREGAEGINPYVYRWADGRPERLPIERARELLAEAGYAGGIDRESGKPLILYFDTAATGPDSKAYLDWLRKQFRKLDLQLVVRATDYNRFQEKMFKGTAQIFQWGWNADYPDPENFLFLLYGPNAKALHQGENAANYDNPEFNRLFERMKNMDNGPERQAIIDQMIEIARRDAPWLWGFYPVAYTLRHQWYHNAKPNLMANNTLKYIRIDPDRRAVLREQWNRPVLWPVWLLLGLLVVSAVPAVISYRRRERASAL